MLSLPWELLHDGHAFLFQGARPVRVRRRLPGTRGYDRPLLDPPIRILLVSPPPEDDACGFVDHRASALPLVEAMEHLGGLVVLTLLHPPTLPALRLALDRARTDGRPYHVIHFDGHGVYDRRLGLGGLCFEDPADLKRLDGRRHWTIHTDDLGPLLKDRRIPLVFLEACQSAQAEAATESVASALIGVGVAGVVAMTHSVLVETARRFVRSFYKDLAQGRRIGDAMLAGQRALKDDDGRGQVFGAGQLRLQDWFVPVLYQERDDPRLFSRVPAPDTVDAIRKDIQQRLGNLPAPPATGFIGRSRELLALERLLRDAHWALIRGQVGEGKTALACELARWWVRSGQARRAAFVSVEQYSTVHAVLDALGHQLVPGYSVTNDANDESGLDQARQRIERALREREQSLYASVELSLARLQAQQRERVRVLGVFQGSVHLGVLILMMDWDQSIVDDLAQALTDTGLATPGPYNHLALNPALCPYLLRGLDAAERADWQTRWDGAMGQYVEYLVQQQSQDSDLSATLTRLELANLLALLDRVEQVGAPEATIGLATSLHVLFEFLGRPRLQQRIARAQDAAEQALGGQWSHAAFIAQGTRIEQQRASGQLQAAVDGASALLKRAGAAGDGAYPGADYDLAIAHKLLARVLTTVGDADQALALLDKAQDRFEALVRTKSGRGAEHMVSGCLTDRGECLLYLGRLDEAAAAYQESIRRFEGLDNARRVAVGKGQLGTVRLQQGRLDEALAAYAEARARFEALGDPGSVAVIWHQTGIAQQDAGRGEAAEDAYRQSLAISVRLGNRAGQASTLTMLGLLYKDVLDRPEEAVAFERQAAERFQEIGDLANEGQARSNLAITLRCLDRLDEARREVRRAIDCKARFGHAAKPWNAWQILSDIETDAGNPDAARAARAKALAAFLAYRHDGGDNHSGSGRLALTVGEQLGNGRAQAAEAELRARAPDPDWSEQAGPFLSCLTTIAQGRRDPALAETAGLSYSEATEILLIERLPPAAGELGARGLRRLFRRLF